MYKEGDTVVLTYIGCSVLIEEGYEVGDRVVLTCNTLDEGWDGIFVDNKEWCLIDCTFVLEDEEE